ncbi:MAG: hypothetical protein LAO21_11980 [Acidobacteriia bacterium]|nr:hypothetical protein [Terriglobia bacterium]
MPRILILFSLMCPIVKQDRPNNNRRASGGIAVMARFTLEGNWPDMDIVV